MFKSIGKIIYSPKSHVGAPNKWAIVSCDDEISKYYRHLFFKQYPFLNGYNLGKKLQRPIMGAHISFVRNESSKLWNIDNYKLIEFEYSHDIYSNGQYFWAKVECPALLDLREKIGLCRFPNVDLHLTIGLFNGRIE